MKVPILDNHVHLRPDGRNVDALIEFSKAGGTAATIVSLPYQEVQVLRSEDFMDSYRITLDLVKRGREATDLDLLVALGPYPVLLIGLMERYGMERAVEVMKEGMDIAAGLVAEGEAHAIGEIGRPHFPVSAEIMDASNEVMLHGMRAAAEAGCPVILHTESVTPETMLELAMMADAAGLDRAKVIKHFSPPLVLAEENHGLVPSIPASRKTVGEALSKGDRFLMETDYIDSPERPGAVMSINSVPKRVNAMLQNGQMTEDVAWKIGKELPEKVYGVEFHL